MPRSLDKAFGILKLDPKGTYTEQDIHSAYKNIARKVHPDKRPGDANAHGQFVDLTEAYKRVLKKIRPPEAEAKVNVTLSVTQAFDTLHSTILAVGIKLDAYSNTKALRKILDDLPYSLDKIILDESARFALILLNEEAVNLEIKINNIDKIGTPAEYATVSCLFITIALSIAVFCIALSLSAAAMLSTATLVGLIAIPPVGGLLVGGGTFFSTKDAHKKRSERQQEMMKIVTAINNLIAAVEESSAEGFVAIQPKKCCFS